MNIADFKWTREPRAFHIDDLVFMPVHRKIHHLKLFLLT